MRDLKKVLIIGAKGFIGTHLARYLRAKDVKVWEADVVVDYRAGSNYYLIDTSNVDFHPLFEKIDYDVCVNCSGAASVPDSLDNPRRDYELNTANVFRLLEAIRTHQPSCRFINLSSAAVYGNPSILPVKEAATVAPLSPYGFHKAMSEEICQEFHRFFSIQTCSLRIFSAYGEGLYKQLFWDLYQKARRDELVKLFGTGEESRDFIYIQDLIRVIELVAKNADFQGEAINVANGEESFIKDVVHTFYSFFKAPVKYQFSGADRKGDPSNWVADISLIKNWGYQPTCSISKGLENYYKWAILQN